MANLILKAEIIRKFGSQLRFAKALDIQELRLSKIIHGRAQPTATEIMLMAQLLKMNPQDLFPKENQLP
jgi:plasmid maintenance system antidote protein VapI